MKNYHWFAFFLLGFVLVVIAILFFPSKPEGLWEGEISDQRRASQAHGHVPETFSEPGSGVHSAGESEAAVVVQRIFTTRVGQLTPLEVEELVAEFVRLPGASGEIEQLVQSDETLARLLGVFLHLEHNGYSEATLALARADSSPHVHAEIGRWLFLNHQFSEMEEYLELMALSLSADDLATLFERMTGEVTTMEVTPLMSRLRLGEGLEWYFSELVKRVPALREQVFSALADEGAKDTVRGRFFEVLESARISDRFDIYAELLDQKQFPPQVHNMLMRRVAAQRAGEDPQMERHFAQMVALIPPWRTVEPLAYREHVLRDLAEVSGELEAMLTDETEGWQLIPPLQHYLNQLHRLDFAEWNYSAIRDLLEQLPDQLPWPDHELEAHVNYLRWELSPL